MEAIILEVIKAIIILGVEQMRLNGKSEDEIKKWASEINALFNELPSAKTLPDV